ncbi:MAG TPA: hypothetical protein VGO46_12975 [Gemmatimonadaceae bacterium]|nr:hypothetical protein [Gemmatimonadaceae bacterium]
MLRSTDNRVVKNGVMWIVIGVSLALLTPWGLAHRQSMQPRLALVAIVCGTLSGAAFFVNGVLAIFSSSGGWRAAILPFCYAISSLLIAMTFLWTNNSTAQNFALAGAVVFMIAAAVLQQRARERADSEHRV